MTNDLTSTSCLFAVSFHPHLVHPTRSSMSDPEVPKSTTCESFHFIAILLGPARILSLVEDHAFHEECAAFAKTHGRDSDENSLGSNDDASSSFPLAMPVSLVPVVVVPS
ncbi:hypothetical protein BDN72DRAFT_462379 [Pluteus cervinus]|uniref:Uncharacterized protein n=1 Tax=Pluteus cervinus TaxID=181527 RepID=A0ACD3AZY2_9AGAR|nr:hypothetical protein BDN72DRAFT_462379 [Pluteus cervinus]